MRKIVLLDFDDTFETEFNGEIIYNEPLIEALIQAQQSGVTIIGFTSWHSLNYEMGSVGRELLLNGLQQRGLKLNATNTTWNFLHVFGLIKKRKAAEQSHQEYIDSLSFEERLELIDHYYKEIKALEENYNYTQGKSPLRMHAFKQLVIIETFLKSLNKDAKEHLRLGKKLENLAEFNGGKEEMFRVILAVLGKNNVYVVFDDKPEVFHVAGQISQEDNVHLYGFVVGRMKEIKVTGRLDAVESFSYEDAIDNPKATSRRIMVQRNNESKIKKSLAEHIAKLNEYTEALPSKRPRFKKHYNKLCQLKEALEKLRQEADFYVLQGAEDALRDVMNNYQVLESRLASKGLTVTEDFFAEINGDLEQFGKLFFPDFCAAKMSRKDPADVSHSTVNFKTLKEELKIAAIDDEEEFVADPADFYCRRYESFADTAHSAIISGSSFTNSDQVGEEYNLDAAASRVVFDKDGVRIGFSVATADGLGHEHELDRKDSLASVSAFSCSQFNEIMVKDSAIRTSNAAEINKEALAQIGKESKNKMNSAKHDSLCSLAATIIYHTEEVDAGSWAVVAKFANIGDGMIAVLDPDDYSVKHCVAARAVNVSPSQYGPVSLQELSEDGYKAERAAKNLVTQTMRLSEGDIIIQMTDGVYEEFACEMIESETKNVYNRADGDIVKAEYIDTVLAKDAFQEVIHGEDLSAHDIAQQIVLAGTKRALEKRNKIINACNGLKDEIESFFVEGRFKSEEQAYAYTIKIWIDDLVEAGKNEAVDQLNWLLGAEGHDGTHYDKAVTPAVVLAKDLSRKMRFQHFGDCSTINVAKVPFYRLELTRALIEHPENHQSILRRINLKDLNITWLYLLEDEKIIPRNGARGLHIYPGEKYLKPAYTKEEIASLKGICLLAYELLEDETPTQLCKTIESAWASDDGKHPGGTEISLEDYIHIYTALKTDGINQRVNQPAKHKSSIGRNYLGHWHELAKKLRDCALTCLKKEVFELDDNQEKLVLLEKYREIPLFNEHRNSWLGGGRGDTGAVKAIDEIIEDIKMQIPQLT